MKPIPPGDDSGPTPPPVDETPPHDRFCDLVLAGGVASGVVYPWAIVEIARAFHFRNIGGTSVGAMAAALAAAAEYGRRHGHRQAFEVLRRTPAALGETLPDGRTRMRSLFQPHADGRRLLALWAQLAADGARAAATAPPRRRGGRWLRVFAQVLRLYAMPAAAGAAAAVAAGMALAAGLDRLLSSGPPSLPGPATALLLVALLAAAGALAGLWRALRRDLHRGLIANGLGLCRGGTLEPRGPEGERPGLVQWLHEAIQESAGLKKTDRPLTFSDLWNAPAHAGAPPGRCSEGDPAAARAINLVMITTNATHGRPYLLPLQDTTSRLFFRREALQGYFPDAVLDALCAAARPYAPAPGSTSDPPADGPGTRGWLELPRGDLPVVVAARLSLSFPLLFAAVPLGAIDYEAPRRPRGADAGPQPARAIRRCWFTDGGASANFPIHLFDAALPRWPTFGLWLGRRLPQAYVEGHERGDEFVWLPAFHGQGRGDAWQRFDPSNDPSNDPAHDAARNGLARARRVHDAADPASWGGEELFGYLRAIATGATDWRDLTSKRLPHVRNRVARLLLGAGEGGLDIAMPRERILHMARTYGVVAGQRFVARFAGEPGRAAAAWSEHRWIRLQVLQQALRELLAGLSAGAAWSAHTVPMVEAVRDAMARSPIADRGAGLRIDAPQAQSLLTLLEELQRLERLLRDAPPQPYRGEPPPALRLRAPL